MRDLMNSGDLGSLKSKSFPIDSARNDSPQDGPVTETKNALDELVSDFLSELNRLSSGQELVRKEPVRTAEFITGLEGAELVDYPPPIVRNPRVVPFSSETAAEVLNWRAGIREKARQPLFQEMSGRQAKNRRMRPIGWLLVLGTLVVAPPAGERSRNNPAGSTGTQEGDRTHRSATVRSKQAGVHIQTRTVAVLGSAITRSRGSDKIVDSSRPAETPDVTQYGSSPTVPAVAGPAAAPQAVPPLSSTNPVSADPGNAIATIVPGNPPPEPGSSAKPPTVPSKARAAIEERPALPAALTRSLPADPSKAGEPSVAVYKPPTPAVVARKVTPTYPSAAKSLGVRRVELDVDVNEAGQVVSAIAVSGPTILRIPSEEALRKWQFIPATRNGVNAKSTIRVSILFTP